MTEWPKMWTAYRYYPKPGEQPAHPQWFAYRTTINGHVMEIIGGFDTFEELKAKICV